MIIRLITLISISVILITGCAWENLPEDEIDRDRIWEVRMVMEGAVDPNKYYFIVFNFSGDINQKPIAALEGIERGLYWDVYYLYGKPGDLPYLITEPPGFYKGLGAEDEGGGLPSATDPKKQRVDPTKPASDENPLDLLPEPLHNQLEYLEARITSSPIEEGGPVVSSNTIYLKFNWRGFPAHPEYVNMNMIVSSMGVDVFSNDPNDDLEVLVWDSFAYNGVSLPIYENDEFLERDYLVEVPGSDQHVPGRTPSGNIVDWSLKILN